MEGLTASRDAVTELLLSAEAGDEAVWEQLVPLVYDELRGLARAQLAREGAATLDTTELVHEAYLRLVDRARLLGSGQAYFFGAAARAMRQVLVDHARRRRSRKRDRGQLTLLPRSGADTPPYDLLELNLALERLAETWPRQARVVECCFFGGLSVEETAETLGVSPRTVKRDWALARAWLYRELHSDTTAAM
jgi:RNA polymerase sigma factor (TIGR02999 family)